MIVEIGTILECSIDEAVTHVQTPRLLEFVAAPLSRDTVEVRAGVLTPFIWLFAQLFYRHRQRRWRALVARRFAYGAA
jgi:hypothetical protein